MALVCLCQGVSERNVIQAIDCGANSRAEIGQMCRAGITCGGCHDTLDALLDEATVHRDQVVAVTRRRIAS